MKTTWKSTRWVVSWILVSEDNKILWGTRFQEWHRWRRKAQRRYNQLLTSKPEIFTFSDGQKATVHAEQVTLYADYTNSKKPFAESMPVPVTQKKLKELGFTNG